MGKKKWKKSGVSFRSGTNPLGTYDMRSVDALHLRENVGSKQLGFTLAVAASPLGSDL